MLGDDIHDFRDNALIFLAGI